VDSVVLQFKNSVPEPIWNILVFLAGIATIVWTIIRSFVFVQPGQVGIRKRFGKPILKYPKTDANGREYTKEEIAYFKAEDKKLTEAYQPVRFGRPCELHPGFNALIPFMHSVEIVDIRRNNIRVGAQRIANLAEFVAYDLEEITVDIRLKDVYLWIIASIDAEAQVKAIIDTELTSILRQYTIEEIIGNDPSISKRLVANTAEELSQLGVLLSEKSLKLGTVKMIVEASYSANAQREIANAIGAPGVIKRFWRKYAAHS
jgi:regulator of protease activity HflC (stomatin/prohibitin superfamily)